MGVPRIPERFLRFLWQNQFLSSPLFTSDGARVVVRFPGVMNNDGGPDFTGALIRIGHVLCRGDVELHVRVSSWRAHGHGTDPHYNRVILHVALLPGKGWPPQRTASGRVVPLLLLPPFVDPLLYDRWMNASRGETVPLIRCRGYGRVVPFDVLRRRIHALGRRRIQNRVRFLRKRLRRLIEESEAGSGEQGRREETFRAGPWEQLFYESLLEGMGYARNRSPFLALARSVSLPLLKAYGLDDTLTMQSILFGAAGLLPSMDTIRDNESRAYVRGLRRRWCALRRTIGVPLLHEGDWMFFRLRPVNFPTARLAAFCFLLPSLFARSLLSRILGVLRLPGATPSERRSALISLFRVSPDRFWSRHYHFRGTRRGGGIALGHARVHELLVNSIVPLLLLYARVYTDGWVRRGSLALLRALPSAGENRLTRLVKAALIGGNTGLRSPVEQQGLLHLYSLYCSRGRCSRCPVRTDLHREKTGTPVEEARGFRMSRRCLPARMSRCSRR